MEVAYRHAFQLNNASPERLAREQMLGMLGGGDRILL